MKKIKPMDNELKDGSNAKRKAPAPPKESVKEIGGPTGLEPTTFGGEWYHKGKCVDF